MADERPVVLYLGGLGRSGTTLLDRMIGRLPGAASAGELVHLWHRGVAGDERCGCGEPFSRCPFWQAVGDAAFGGWRNIDGQQVHRLQRSVDRTRFVPLLLMPSLHPGFARRLDEFSELIGALYRAMADVSGARVLVDSSKHASYAYLLRQTRQIDLRLLHVVRSAEGVAYSWSKRVARPELDGRDVMPVYSPLRVGGRWLAQNALFDILGHRLGVPTELVRYEDSVRSPREVLRRAARLAGLPEPSEQDLRHVRDGWVDLGTDHTVAGNPMRFRTGAVHLALDEEWRVKLPRRPRRTVVAMSLPLRQRYGYALDGSLRPP